MHRSSPKPAQARAVVNAARSEAEKAKGETLDAAHEEAEKLRKDVHERVKTEEAAAENEVNGSIPELVALLSGRLTGTEVSEKDGLINECVSKAQE